MTRAKTAKIKGAQMKARKMKIGKAMKLKITKTTSAENARTGMKIVKTAEINAAGKAATRVDMMDAETVTAEMITAA